MDKLDMVKLVHVPADLNDLKTKVDDLDVSKLKTVPADLKKLSDAEDKEVVKNTKFKTLKTKVNNLEKKIPDVTTLIHINQYNIVRENLERKIGDVDIRILDTIGLVTTIGLNTKFSEVENKILDSSCLVTTTILNKNISVVENKIPDHAKHITTPELNKLTAEKFEERLKQANLVGKTDFDNKLTSFNKRITSNKTKHLQV